VWCVARRSAGMAPLRALLLGLACHGAAAVRVAQLSELSAQLSELSSGARGVFLPPPGTTFAPTSPSKQPTQLFTLPRTQAPTEKRSGGSKSCKSPVPVTATLRQAGGCVDFVQTSMLLLDRVVNATDGNGVLGDPAFLNQFFRPVLSSLQSNIGKTFPGLNSNVCFDNFQGSTILKAPPTGINSALLMDKCNKIPVDPDSEFMIFSFSIPVSALQGACESYYNSLVPSKRLTTMASMCLAISVCDNNLPTLGSAFDAGMFGCLFGQDALVTATAGVTYIVSQLGHQTLAAVSSSVSLTDNLQKSLTVYDAQDGLVSVTAHGNFGATIDFKLTSDKIGLPKFLEVGGSLTLLVGLMNAAALANPRTDISKFLSGLTGEFMIAATGQGSVTYDLQTATYGMFPKLKFVLGSATALITSNSKAVTNLDAGLYIYAQGNDAEAAVMNAIIGTILPLVNNIIDAAFGKGATEQFIKYAKPDDTGSTKLGLAVNADYTGLYMQVPVGAALKSVLPFNALPGIQSFAGAVEFDLRVSCRDGSISFNINYLMSAWMTMLLKDGLRMWIAGSKFFDASGKVVAAVAQDVLEFTEDEINKCSQAIASGSLKVGDSVKNWAKSNNDFGVGHKIDDIAKNSVDSAGKQIVSAGKKIGKVFGG
jgi:hypothetical protein